MTVTYTIAPRERDVQKEIVRKLRGLGWAVFTTSNRMATATSRGMADLCVMRSGHTVWIECKSKQGKQSDDQKRFRFTVEHMGGATYILARSWGDVESTLKDRGIW